ncbi:MAG TPA: UDP-N-acetylglucosamine 1-carboxyvinyltransferase [Elusimicrobia bacterium]|nr:MAG: UDP-N-acetylglucosamine 1-carboxyvinyltransferase [Elusimicrobia bacterium RIFOXYA12_FULL_49_49]OGS11896.1 MAG: UDP-N-acetylglucosamine 1-carboxyvinyltransferase [Elusimicrobia bacterium RIFOXYB1_FULL_48_9]OGS16852.1 MAG: UDP-N-acetylglucosamine 1-carboxyvinyltransferase [Elusimicrobia bacterium RIFOXYA2_FULL_47_53]OGS32080.1 MAG: UDP-N-acetylglucosamine 1-carboxyvinyltransferase [Elusimicrobia bacterium RIFOXYB2_FULL_46_23]HBU69973.1 UDP-N-acetylglucosamine 1-carboxyvinyltransferase [E
MDKIIIHGGRKLNGTIRISGSKNAALPILAASLLTDEVCEADNVPDLADIGTTVALLEFIGKKVERRPNKVIISPDKQRLSDTAPYDLVRKMRASVLVMGPLLARLGHVKVSLPGGCAIGARPIDIHLDGFSKMGAEIELSGGYVEVKAKELSGARIVFRYPSVGATENLLLASVLAKGPTIIENAAREPEIIDLADVLNKMGAKITGAGQSTIHIHGVDKLGGFKHEVIPDRIETATYLIAAAVTKGSVKLLHTNSSFIKAIVRKLVSAGLKITEGPDYISAKWTKNLKPQNIRTAVYPDFPTDVQAQWMALMALVPGSSYIEETVFENRFLHVGELQRLGADLRIRGSRVIINGVKRLSGAPIMVSDLRAGAALIIAGLAAGGKTEVLRVYHLDRGYEKLEQKLRKLGARVRRISY